jgi:hypothetical protein
MDLVQYIAALMCLITGVVCLRSAPGRIIPYLRRRARTPKDFESGLKVAMTVRRAMGVAGIGLAIFLVLKEWAAHN